MTIGMKNDGIKIRRRQHTCECNTDNNNSNLELCNSDRHERKHSFLNMGNDANCGFTNDDSSTATRLLDKNWSPLIVRKYQYKGWPCFVSLICDANLDDLDKVFYKFAEIAEDNGFTGNSIQSARNFCGYMSDMICEHYNNIKSGCVEGVAILWYIDKCFISSLYGDYMVHSSCKQELFNIINTLPHI